MNNPVPNKLPNPIFSLFKRYGAVLRAAWQARHDLAGPRRLANEAAFLPAALSLQESPVHPAPRRAMWLIMALFVFALLWALLGRVDVVAVAQGRVIVSDRTKLIQPLEPAVVKAIHVKDGDRVKAGQVLVELDPTIAVADTAGVQETLRSAQQEAARSLALLQALAQGRAPAAAAPEAQALLQAEWLDISAKQSKLAAEIARRGAELATARGQVAKIKATLPMARQRESDLKALAADGYAPANTSADRTRERIELEADLATLSSRVVEAESALAENTRAREAYDAEVRRQLSDRLTQARLKAAQLQQEGAKFAQRERQTRLLAPVDGTVQQLAVHTTGGVVTSAQPLMVIVPDGAAVSAEVVIDNKDIGFVAEGQSAEIKFDTFSFTRYGTVPATVSSVSADAVADEKRGLVFVATLALQQSSMQVDQRSIRLSPGMNLAAEIKLGQRRVIDYLLDPIKTATHESLRER